MLQLAVLDLELQLVAPVLRRGEDHGRIARLEVVPQHLDQPRLLLLGAQDQHCLFDVLVRGELVAPGALADANLCRLSVGKGSRDRLHVLGPRGREEQGLAALAGRVAARVGPRGLGAHPDDLADVRLEAHVEHAVCLVQDEVRHLVQLDDGADVVLRLRRGEVDQAARRGEEDVHALLQLPALVALRDAAVDADGAGLHRARDLRRLRGDLLHELARRREDQRARLGGLRVVPVDFLRLGRRPRRRDADERGQQEREGLPAPRLGDGDHVLPLEGERPPLRLDRGRCWEALLAQRLREGRAELRLGGVEGLVRRRAAGLDLDAVRLPVCARAAAAAAHVATPLVPQPLRRLARRPLALSRRL
mmetsp:Transcript_57167/g.161401  ORF Transcript_57167/g.161401 Transcript_57167/m.161401 type:complete len:363 (-) Transcript_57167:470-1558(-)